MDAVGRVLCESEHEKGPHKPILFVNPSVDKYAVNAAFLKFMACGITYHWQLNLHHHL
jgi:hypothetical protein